MKSHNSIQDHGETQSILAGGTKTNLKKSAKCCFNKPLGIRLPQEHIIIPASHRFYFRLSTCEAQFYLGLIRQPETKSLPNVSSNPPLLQFIPNERGMHHPCLPPPSSERKYKLSLRVPRNIIQECFWALIIKCIVGIHVSIK
ncbi:hypothetical protein CDAR_576101 [Caerostris darwini]|uniref:Uncharacterized protein n=1 Tax=Caerostris darwini TaxID=1538125 RepID=A0AAV4X237_9ARAC|nr:hypothetical protein CDAR_576101 [Caerostris darwini]